jgi:hypothetical protein
MKQRLILFFLTILLVSCSPSSEEINRAIEETQKVAPTKTTNPTQTPVPLDSIELSKLIFLDGDLPTGYYPGQIRSEGEEEVKKLKETPINEFHQDVEYKGEVGGRISIFLFETLDSSRNSFEHLKSELESDNWQSKKISDLGEDSFGQEIFVPLIGGLDPIQASLIVFYRCNALVYAELELSESYSGLVDYCTQLDKRLSETICQ